MRFPFRALRLFPVFGAALLLGACSIFGNQVSMELSEEMKQKCPPVGIVAYTGQVTRFSGAGFEASDVAYRASISGLQMTCTDSEDEAGLYATIQFDIQASQGPAGASNTADFPFFVNVTRGSEAVLERNTYISSHTFEDGYSAYRETVNAYVPLNDDGAVGDIEILVGLQLTRDELGYNIAR